MKMQKIMRFICFLIISVVLCLFFFILGSRWQEATLTFKRIAATKGALGATRKQISDYKSQNGKYPDSIIELDKYYNIKINNEKGKCSVNEYISNKHEGNNNVSSMLDGSGGWFYSPDTGEFRVNLLESIKEYFPNHQIGNPDEVPSSW